MGSALLTPSDAIAQQAEPADEVIVTGTKRESTLQDSDLSVTVLDKEAIDEARLRDVRRVDDLVPNVQFNEKGQLGGIFVTIRGVETFLAPGASAPKPQEHIARRGYGLGFNVMELHGTTVYFHSGGIAGFNAYLIHVPRSDTTLVAIANTEDALVPVLKDILSVVAR